MKTEETKKMKKLIKLWKLFLNYHFDFDPNLDLEEWDEVFREFLKKPDEVLKHWDDLAGYDIDPRRAIYSKQLNDLKF